MNRSHHAIGQLPRRGNVRLIRLGELFCGPGGLAKGASWASVQRKSTRFRVAHQWATDYDPDTCATFQKNICPEGPDSVICADVRKLDLASLPPIDAFAYGFPCNDFSVVGERRGFNGTFGPLYSYGVKVISLHNPLFFLAENVGGLTSAHGGNALKAILGDLESAGTFGYGLTTHYYRAEDYGVPQTRHRLIIVGIRRDLGKRFCVPRPTTKDSPVTVYTALQGIPDNAPNNEHTRQSQKVVERLMATKPGENAWTANLPDHLKLNVKTTRLSQIYKRLDPNKPAYTITGSGGGGTHCYHWEEPRALTNRERARIQTFPDDFVFEGSKESVRKQIGMAVPPLLAKVIFEAALKTLLAIPYDSVRASHEEISSLPFTPDCAPADGGCHECCRSH